MHSPTTSGWGMHLTQRHAGCRESPPQPVPVVQHGGIGSEKGWNSALLHEFLQAQHMYQKGLIPTAMDTGSTGQYGWHHTFFDNGH